MLRLRYIPHHDPGSFQEFTHHPGRHLHFRRLETHSDGSQVSGCIVQQTVGGRDGMLTFLGRGQASRRFFPHFNPFHDRNPVRLPRAGARSRGGFGRNYLSQIFRDIGKFLGAGRCIEKGARQKSPVEKCLGGGNRVEIDLFPVTPAGSGLADFTKLTGKGRPGHFSARFCQPDPVPSVPPG